MTAAKTMAEVLAEHNTSYLIGGGWHCFKCDLTFAHFREANAHQAAMLTAAGFGLVVDAQAEAWDEGANTAWERSTPIVNGLHYKWRHEGEPPNPYRAAALRGQG